MDTSNNDNLHILDLPDEILLIIFNKLNTIDVLYSLVDVIERFDRLVLNSLHIRNLDTTNMVMKSYFDRTFSIDNNILSRISEKILPRIHHQLTELIVEQNSVKHILLNADYPQLDSLSLVNFQKEMLFQNLTGNPILRHLVTQQILHLNIDVSYEPESSLSKTLSATSKILSSLFILILSGCQRLISLNYCQLFYDRKTPICIDTYSSTSGTSSTLTELKVNVTSFIDCLYLLEYLKCLSTLIIDVKIISLAHSVMKMDKLPKLKCFSLTSIEDTSRYPDEVIPLLRRMINLNVLTLFLSLRKCHWTTIDGIQLRDQILIYMPQLNKFTFSINAFIRNDDIQIGLPSNEVIQHSFIWKGYGQIGSYIHVRPERNVGVLHVYSLPYQFEYFLHLNNSFQGDMFDRVQCSIMTDGCPFEHDLFKLISQCFPLLKELHAVNCKPQKNKQYSFGLIRFSRLILLNLLEADVDYAEQLLYDKSTYLPALLDLCIEYKSLRRITNDFTNDAICRNCAKLKKLSGDWRLPTKKCYLYFPSL